jgi:hypothetical protein
VPTPEDYRDLADRWDRWLVDTNTLLSDSTMHGAPPPPNLVDHAYAAMLKYPDQLRATAAGGGGGPAAMPP